MGKTATRQIVRCGLGRTTKNPAERGQLCLVLRILDLLTMSAEAEPS